MFANMTETALSGTYKAGAWRFARYREQNNSMAVLCTDGISETIEPESIDTFIKNLYAFSLANSEEDCAKSAEQWLANWPAPACHDDKTVAVMIRGGKP
jgi:serine/threonine protein phosphatase PrpC